MQRALPIAGIMALVGAFLLFLYLRHFERTMSGGEKVSLLVAIKPIKRGEMLTDESLGAREVPLAYVESRAIGMNDRAKVIGVRASQSVNAQDLLLWTDLALAAEERDLSSLIQPGNRAVTVQAGTEDESKGYALIKPGDYVDVLVTTESRDAAGSGSAAVLLQRVLVLALGLETTATGAVAKSKEDTSQQRNLLLTLSLNLQEAQLLALATVKGRLSVALRNPDDQRVVEGVPDLSSTALLDSRARTDIQGLRRGAVVPSAAVGPVKVR